MIFSKEILEQTLLALDVDTQKKLLEELQGKADNFLNDYQKFGKETMIEILENQITEYETEREEKNIADEGGE